MLRGPGDIRVICGGVIPPQGDAVLRRAGNAEIFGPGTNVLEAAAALIGMLEGLRCNTVPA